MSEIEEIAPNPFEPVEAVESEPIVAPIAALEPITEEEAEAEAALAEDDAKHKGKSGSARLKERLERERERADRLERELAASKHQAPHVPGFQVPGVPSLDQFTAQYPDATYEDYEGFKIQFAIHEAERRVETRLMADRAKTNWETRAAKLPGFNTAEAVQAVKEAAGTSFGAAVWDSIEESEQGPEILDYLQKHEEEARRFAGLSERQTIKELGRLEERLAAKVSPPNREKPISQAPAPIPPIVARGAAVNPSRYDRIEEF